MRPTPDLHRALRAWSKPGLKTTTSLQPSNALINGLHEEAVAALRARLAQAPSPPEERRYRQLLDELGTLGPAAHAAPLQQAWARTITEIALPRFWRLTLHDRPGQLVAVGSPSMPGGFSPIFQESLRAHQPLLGAKAWLMARLYEDACRQARNSAWRPDERWGLQYWKDRETLALVIVTPETWAEYGPSPSVSRPNAGAQREVHGQSVRRPPRPQ